MKKTIFIAAIATLCTLVSCQKEDTLLRDSNGDLIFTASIAGPETRTSINTTDGKVSWVSGDEITITDASSTSVNYVVSGINEGTATFTKKSGETGTLGAGPYTATYLDDFNFKNQTYSATVPALPMSASSSTTNLTFTVNCALIEFCVTNVKSSQRNLGIIKVGTTSDTDNAYVLQISNLPIASKSSATVYFAVPAGTYNWCYFADTTTSPWSACDNNVYNKGITFNANCIYKINHSYYPD